MNTFETLENRCRICALELSDLTCTISIFGDITGSFCLQNKISKYLNITVLEEDLLPKKICSTCFLKIESIDKFAYSAAKNQECFISWLERNYHGVDVSQTTIETSTNSDFSFNNITIKKEFDHRQQIVFQPNKSRNARHVDHITLEQIINDQIIKNPKLPASTTITKIVEPKASRQPVNRTENSNPISIVSYNNLQIGQLIKDYELLKLILRALKWEEYDRKASYQELIERLRRSNCRDILTNKNLLSDNDVVQLLRSYVNDSMLNNLKSTPHQNISMIFEPQAVVVVPPPVQKVENSKAKKSVNSQATVQRENIEVSIDPGIFLADEESITIEDDEETVSAAEAKFEDSKLQVQLNEPTTKPSDSEDILPPPVSSERKNIEIFHCTSCPETFTSNTEVQNHVITHMITSTTSTNTKRIESAIEKLNRKKKPKQDKLKRKKKVIIRINPGPSRSRSNRAKPQINQFVCALCKRSLSSKRNLQSHIETHKEPSGKFKCDGESCKKLFANLENFVKHRQESHEKPSRKRKRVNEK